MTQAQKLVLAIRAARSKGLTDGEQEALKVSTCPWRRLAESAHRYLRPGEQLLRKVGKDGLKRSVIVRARG